MALDRDLQSIQEVRDLMKRAVAAQKEFQSWGQERVDALVKTIADACTAQAEPLAKMAQQETGFGIWQDKVIKNLPGSRITYESIRSMKTVGIIREDREKKLLEVAVPVGVVAALIPSTNPTSTTMYKTLISVKAGNAIVVSPHPNAKKCILETVRIIQEAAKNAGAPDGLIQCIETTTMQATDALLKHPDTGIILATGGAAMVKAAYSSGNPALGVGPGNGPAFIERSADIPLAVKHIMDSKTFDNGTICASEQSIVTERCIRDAVAEELKRQGGYFLDQEQSKKLEKMLMRSNNCVLLQRGRHTMYHYMAAMHQRFFQAPDFAELEGEIEQARQEVRDCLGQAERRKLMQLVDAKNLLREKISLASFAAGFKLAWGLAREVEVTPHGEEES